MNARINEKKTVADLQDRFDRAITKAEKEHIISICKFLNITIKVK